MSSRRKLPSAPRRPASLASTYRDSSMSVEAETSSNPNFPGSSLSSTSFNRLSTLSVSASTSRPSTARPSTASGRRSRATTASSAFGLSEAKHVICAVSEARAVSPSVGVAFINISTGEVVISQICDNQSYVKTIHKIQISSPSRVIFMPTACPPNAPSVLFSLVNELIPEAQIDTLDRSAWSETMGLEYLHEFALKDDIGPIKVAIQSKFYAISSFSAAMKYVERKLDIKFVKQSLRVRYQPSEDTMMIDIAAIQSLEIMQNSRNPKSKDCLYGLINQTLTPMGARMLRSNILQPPTGSDNFIAPRYDAVTELTTVEDLFRGVRKALKLFFDVEKLLTKLIIVPTATEVYHVEEQINQVLMVKRFVEAIPELHHALSPARSELLLKIRDLCQPQIVAQIHSKICKTIEADVTYMTSPLDLRNQRTFAVKSGISGMLDVARQTYKELTEYIHRHVEQLNEAYGLEGVLKFDNGRKYWIRVQAADFETQPLPEILINAVRKKDKIECQTLDLVKLNMRLTDAANEVVIRSDGVVYDLIQELRQDLSHLFRACESVALLDMLASFAQVTTTQDYTRPHIESALALKAARHPVLNKAIFSSFVPNDYYATNQHCFHIVTGCNMSGKSTYIRSIALLQVMAQIGCFVPAEYAAFPIIHNIFARVSLDDNLASNLSSFAVEMREMAFILRNIDRHSLVVVDELGRATSTRDGLAIAMAMAEALIQSKALVWFATHFADLARVLGDRPGVLNLHLAADCDTTSDGLPRITMLYKATAGRLGEHEHYGIDLARALGMPQTFIDKALEVAEDLKHRRITGEQSSESAKLNSRRKLILNLYDALKQAKDSDMEDLSGYLQRLQDEFTLKMDAIDNR